MIFRASEISHLVLFFCWKKYGKICQEIIFLVAKYSELGYYSVRFDLFGRFYGRMAELVDALVSGTSGSNTLEVRVLLRPPGFWGCSSVDRALRSHRRGRGFESHQLHQ